MTRRAKKAAPAPEAPAAAAPFDPREPKAENLIDQLGASGWDFFRDGGPHANALKPPENAKQTRLALVAMVLWNGVPEFRELVEHLLDVSVRRAEFHPSLGLPINEAYGYGMFREGQNSILYLVLKMIAEGRSQVAPPPREA